MTGSLADRYELVEQIGRGGMGSIWRAKAHGFGGFERTCVIKRVLRGKGPTEDERVAMFVREARLCALLSHRNIVQVFDFGVADGEYYLAMEYVHGRNLLDLCRALAGQLPPVGAIAYVVREVASALAYAHELTDEQGRPLGLVHRDVTPSNVLVGSDGSVKLLDFGVAKAVAHDTGLTRLGQIKGKLPYMSPEQVSGGNLDGRSDVFAAGVLLHELLCARRLFRGQDNDETLQRLLGMQIPPPSEVHPDVPPGLDAICLRALSRDRESRFCSAAAMAEALDPIVRALGWDAGRLAAWVRALSAAAPLLPAEAHTPAVEVECTELDVAVDFEPTPAAHACEAEATAQRRRAPLLRLSFGLLMLIGAVGGVVLMMLALG
jgi:serine/threonine-protein kinase